MHCLNQKKWRDPSDIARVNLELEIQEITDLITKSEFEIERYNEIFARYLEWKKEVDSIKAIQKPIFSELKKLRGRFLSKFLHRKAIAELEKRLSETDAQFDRLLHKYHQENPLLNPIDNSVIGVGHYEDYLCWTTSTRSILPWDTHDKMIFGSDVDEVYSYQNLMPANTGIPWLIENELNPLKERLSALKRQLEVRG